MKDRGDKFMNKKAGVVLAGIIVVVLLIILFVAVVLPKKDKAGEESVQFSKDIAPYTEKETETFTFTATDTLDISALCCDVTVSQDDCTDIIVELHKMVGDKKEENLKNELEHIVCKMKQSKLFLGFEENYNSKVNSKYVKAEIKIPKSVENLQLASKSGNLDVRGSYQQLAVYSNTGDINVIADELEADDVFEISGEIGDVNIRLPKQSKINITGQQKNDIQVGNGIVQSEEGAVIEVNRSASKVKISAA